MAENRAIFITGSSTGLGRATAKLFASHGWRVVATMRKPEADTELKSVPNVTLLRCDVTKPDEIAAAATEAIAGGPIDVLFNNAGYGLAGAIEGTTDEQLVDEIDTNILGVIRTTKAFLPHFRERRKGLIITTTSIGGLVAFPLNAAYHATKWAMEGFSESLSHELEPFGIGVKTVAPGGIKTDFFGRSMVMAQHPAYADIAAKVLSKFMDPERAKLRSTAEQIAEVVYEAATDGKRQIRYVAGEDAKAAYAQRNAAGNEAFREATHKHFFG